ncbi:O-antigen polymerase [Cloacibacillus porcorum]|uniref:O-antigen polymerase n=1 Tax=Cloacibacillus porcorum TaxID=1197717 RepID=UPI0009FCA037|nr:O-antigen polymerase [Cloacibacillus porcorum]
MFIFIYLLLLCIIITLTYFIYKSIFRSNVIFSLAWLVCASFACYGYSNIDRVSFLTNFYVVIYVIFFNFIYFVINSGSLKNCRLQNNNVKCISSFRLPITLNIIALVMSIPLFFKAIRLISTFGFADFRAFAFVASAEFASTPTLIFFQNIIQPLYTATYIFIASGYINDQRSKVLNFIALFTMFFNTIMFGGRDSIYQLIIIASIYILLRIEIYGKRGVHLLKYSMVLSSTMVLGYFAVAARKFSGYSVIDTILLYYYGGFVFFDKKIQNYIIKDAYMGGISYGFILNFLYIPLRALAGNVVIPLYDYASTMAHYIDIGRVQYNALGTVMLSNIYDFGSYLYLLGMLPISIYIAFSDRLYYRSQNDLFFCSLRIYAIICAIRCVQSNPTSNIDFSMVLLFLYTFTKKRRFLHV